MTCDASVWSIHGGRRTVQPSDEFDVLDTLSKTGPLPSDIEERYLQLRRQRSFEAGLMCDRRFPVSPSRMNANMSFTDWLKVKWSTADSSVKKALRAVASTVGASIPMSRTRDSAIDVSDSSPTRRTAIEHHPNQAEARRKESTAENEPENYDGPQWHDDDAPEWEPCETLQEALHPEDRGWF